MKYISYNAVIIFFLACIVIGAVVAALIIMMPPDPEIVCAKIIEYVGNECSCPNMGNQSELARKLIAMTNLTIGG